MLASTTRNTVGVGARSSNEEMETLNEELRSTHAGCRDALRSGDEVTTTLDAVNRRGRALRCRVPIRPLRGADPSAAATLLMDPIAGDEG